MICGITLPAVQGFYLRGYRQDMSALVVVGDAAVNGGRGLEAGRCFARQKITQGNGLISVGGCFRLFTLVAFISFNAIFTQTATFDRWSHERTRNYHTLTDSAYRAGI